MFSSLPSASKIYISAAKSKQKHSNPKKKRKKSLPVVQIEGNIDDTLISLENSKENEISDISSSTNHSTNNDFYHKSQVANNNYEENSPKVKPDCMVSDNHVIEEIQNVTNNHTSAPEINHVSKDIDPKIEEKNSKHNECLQIPTESSVLTEENSEASNDFVESHVTETTCDNQHENIPESCQMIDTFKKILEETTSETDHEKLEENTVLNEEKNIFPDSSNLNISETSSKEIETGEEKDNHNGDEPIENPENDIDLSTSEDETINPHSICVKAIIETQHVSDSTEVFQTDLAEDKNIDVKNEKLNLIHSPDLSELSYTESMSHECKSLISDEQNKTSIKCLKNLDEGINDSAISISNNSHSNICHSYFDLRNIKTYHKKSLSWPNKSYPIFDSFLNINHSKVTKFSDKATITAKSDFTDSYKEIKVLSNEEPERCKHLEVLKKQNKSVHTSFKSFTSQNILPPLAMTQARSRSYVFGSMGPKGSLLGNEELNRFFPDNTVTVFIGTWNMNGENPPNSIDDFLLPLNISTLPDIYAVGVQESMQSKNEWEILLQTTLGPSHVLFTSSSLGVLHLSIFLRRDLIWFCSEPEEANVATRPGTMVKTKGAVAVSFMLFGTSFLFVNSHLTAHEQKLKERFSDYEKICSTLDLPKSISVKTIHRDKDVTSRFDCVFWCGDLNFRVTHDRPSVLSFVEKKAKSARTCSFLIKHDQLHKAMSDGYVFQGFKEGVINFIPSYKFDIGTSTFDSSKLRVPSYTDRILYRSKEKSSISCLHYDSSPNILTSDHKPVFSVFNVSLKPGRDNVPLAAGMFKRNIYLEAIKRRAKFLDGGQNQSQSTICLVM